MISKLSFLYYYFFSGASDPDLTTPKCFKVCEICLVHFSLFFLLGGRGWGVPLKVATVACGKVAERSIQNSVVCLLKTYLTTPTWIQLKIWNLLLEVQKFQMSVWPNLNFNSKCNWLSIGDHVMAKNWNKQVPFVLSKH